MLETIILNILGEGYSNLSLRKKIREKVKNIVTIDVSNTLRLNKLDVYIEKIARNAYKITDEDINNLKNIGFTEEEIYEITVVGAFSAGEHRVNIATDLLNNTQR